MLVVQQLLVGAALGLAMQVAFAAIELAGDMIGLQMGLSFAAFIDPVRIRNRRRSSAASSP